MTTARLGYLPYITPTAIDIVDVDDPATRAALAHEAARERRQQLARERRDHNAAGGPVLEARPHEHADQELAELEDLYARSVRDTPKRGKVTPPRATTALREHSINDLATITAGWSRR